MATSRKGGIVANVITSGTGSAGLKGRPLSGSVLILGEMSDTIPPLLSNVDPPPGSGIYAATVLSFDITDNRDLRLVEIQIDQATREVVHDGNIFLYPYLNSSRTGITSGYHFEIVRSGGWIKPPIVHLRAFDIAFNEPEVP